MSAKLLSRIAIVMIIVFGATVLLYPLIYNPDAKSTQPIEAPPVAE